MKQILIIPWIMMLVICTLSFVQQQGDPWKVPGKYLKMKNPVIADDASIRSGKELYTSYCRSCHGVNGKGDGKRSYNLSTPLPDFNASSFQQQPDGALLYKIYFGHRDMPGFKKRVPCSEGVTADNFGNIRVSGDLVNYVRTFGNK